MLAAMTMSVCGQQTAEEWLEEGNARFIQGKYTDAILAFDEAIRLDPELSPAWIGKGNALGALGRASEANAAYDRARELGSHIEPSSYWT
jgi:Flp pilus assembly protein TadD